MTKPRLSKWRILRACVPLVATVFWSACGGGGGSPPANNPPPPAPAIKVQPATLVFPDEPVGSSSALVLTVTNTGTAALTINQPTVTPGEFQLQSGLTFPLSISPGFSSTWNVMFMPDKAQAFTGTLSIASNASGSPTTVPLSGMGITPAPAIKVSPQSLAFANQPVGTSASQTVTVTNNGNANLTITQATVTPSEFQVQPSVTPTTPISLSPGTSTNFTVTFAPDKVQPFPGTFVIMSNDPTSPTNIAVAGTGIANSKLAINASPISIDFGQQVMNTSSPPVLVTVTNIGTSPVTIKQSTVTVSAPFAVTPFPDFMLIPGQQMPLSLTFAPTSVRGWNGTLTISDDTGSAFASVSLAGVGTSTAGEISVTPASLIFGNQIVGSSSPQTMITLTNTANVTQLIVGVGVSGPFPGIAFDNPITLNAGMMTQFPVAFTPSASGAATGNLGIFFSNNTLQFVSLSGTGVDATSVAVTTPSPLPAATQNAPYLATLNAFGGIPPYNWAPGTSLATNLSLSSSGILSGTISTPNTGNFSFIAQVTDSSNPPATVAATLTFSVSNAPYDPMRMLTANCNPISYSPPGSPPLVPLTELGSNTYAGQVGGLYGDLNNPGSNTDPAAHQSAGVTLAQSIQPLDGNGMPDPNGKYVLVSIGMSNARNEFAQFISDAGSDSSVNPHLLIVNGAQPSFGANDVADPNNKYWTNLLGSSGLLSQAGVTANQVVAAWVKEAIAGPPATETFDQYTSQLQGDFEAIARNLHMFFPNIKLAYYAARIYGGYNPGSIVENPEPFAYWSGFANRAAILDQINNPCPANLNFDPTQCGGTVNAPWMAWGPYFWANGMTPRQSDGLVWTCQDVVGDGTHPSASGRQKVANMLLGFFTTDPTTTPWFLAH